jgi:hypothetical protein
MSFTGFIDTQPIQNTRLNKTIDQLYEASCRNYSDIFEHIPTLKKYASEQGIYSVAEYGVRGTSHSSVGLMKGLIEGKMNDGKDRSYIGVDISPCEYLYMQEIAKIFDINYKFEVANSATYKFKQPVDLLFIDSWHIFGHLSRELESSHSSVNKYIIMHDTEIDKMVGESVRCNLDIEKQAEESGYPVEEIVQGLQPAIDQFLEKHSEWRVKEVFTNNNGLTVLEKISN